MPVEPDDAGPIGEIQQCRLARLAPPHETLDVTQLGLDLVGQLPSTLVVEPCDGIVGQYRKVRENRIDHRHGPSMAMGCDTLSRRIYQAFRPISTKPPSLDSTVRGGASECGTRAASDDRHSELRT